jgi:purine-cytosine permease-like protein
MKWIFTPKSEALFMLVVCVLGVLLCGLYILSADSPADNFKIFMRLLGMFVFAVGVVVFGRRYLLLRKKGSKKNGNVSWPANEY